MRAAIVGASIGGLATLLSGCGSSEPTKPSKCYALALSGGGDKVAWVAGVVKGLVERMEGSPEERQWQVVTGMSTGSLLASLAATYKIGDEASMSDHLMSTALGFTNTPAPAHVSMSWPPSVDAANQSGLLNTSILVQTLEDLFSDRVVEDRMFSIGATSDATGKLTMWDEADVMSDGKVLPSWTEYLRAAMSAPGTDEPVTIDGVTYSSGSVILGTDVFSAVLKCQEAGFANHDIVIDVVTSHTESLGAWNATTDDHTLPLAGRGDEITAYNLHMSDIFDACNAYPNVSWRYFVEPGPDGLPSAGTEYNSTTMAQMGNMGIVAGKTATMGKHCSLAESHRHSTMIPQGPTEQRAVESSKCYAMALSGGGAKGAYEAGVLKGLIDRLSASERQWQLFTGISAGSILTAGSSLFDVGQEEAMAEFLMKHVLDLTNTNSTVGNVYIDWPNASQELTETGFENTAPLFNTLKNLLSSHPFGNRKFVIGSTEDATGKLNLYDETMVLDADGSFNVTKLATFVRASSAIPGIFESVKIDGKVHNDGGVVMGVNVFSAIHRCKAAGYAESDIVLDLITCATDRLAGWNESLQVHASEIKARAANIQSFALGMADIFDACRAYPEVDWRFYVQAPADLPGSAATFDTTAMQAMMQVGLSDAANASVGIHCSQAEKFRKSNIVKHSRKKTFSIAV